MTKSAHSSDSGKAGKAEPGSSTDPSGSIGSARRSSSAQLLTPRARQGAERSPPGAGFVTCASCGFPHPRGRTARNVRLPAKLGPLPCARPRGVTEHLEQAPNVAPPRRPSPSRERRARASSRAGRPRPSTSEHAAAEPAIGGRQTARSPKGEHGPVGASRLRELERVVHLGGAALGRMELHGQDGP